MPPETARGVGVFTAACLLVSNAVGSGIFTTTGFLARDLGSPVLILALWAAGGALALAGALSYSELGAALPRVGGEYVYLRRAYGPLCGFLSGWTSFTMGFGAATAAAAAAFAAYLIELVPAARVLGGAPGVALLLVWTLAGVHVLGVERGGAFQRWITVAKISGIALLASAALALGGGDWAHLAADPAAARPRVGTVAVALVFVLYSYSGWNAAAYIAGELSAPARTLPRALLGGTLFVTLLYLAVNLAYLLALPVAALAAEPVLPVAEKVAEALLGPEAAQAVVAVLCLSIAGATSSMIWAGPRVLQAMAQDGAAPRRLARTARSAAPVTATVAQTLWISALLVTGTFEQLVVYSGVALAIFGALAVSAVVALRRREPQLPRPVRVPGYPWVPLAYVLASLGIAAYATWERPREALLSIATVLVGIPLYRLLAGHRLASVPNPEPASARRSS